ncbi:MAG: anti-sigma factor family protein [Gemmatimonadota bacterium]
MDCSTFLEGYSDLRDGTASPAFRREAEEHLARCGRCSRYHRVVEAGLQVLRSGPVLDVPSDFHPRLQHRLYHVDDEAALLGHANSGTTALAVLGIALLLTLVVWSPLLRPREPVVELEPIVVSEPPAALRLQPVLAFPAGTAPGSGGFVPAGDLFDDAHRLIFEYSPLFRNGRASGRMRRAGMQQDH